MEWLTFKQNNIEFVGRANEHFDLAFLHIITTGKKNFVQLGSCLDFVKAWTECFEDKFDNFKFSDWILMLSCNLSTNPSWCSTNDERKGHVAAVSCVCQDPNTPQS